MIGDKNKHFQNKLYEMNNYFESLKHLIDKKNFPKVLMLNGKKGQGKFTMVHHLLSYYFLNHPSLINANFFVEVS